MTTGTDEDALIEAVIRVRLAGESVADVHAKLSSEFPAATTGEVKKACSKATKRTGGVLPAAAPATSETAATTETKTEAQTKKEAKKAKMAADALKAAQSAMLDSQRKLKLAKDPDTIAAQIPAAQMDAFMQRATKLAVSGTLGPGDANVINVRVEADIAMLEWLRLANDAGEFKFTEDMIALGGELQLKRLKEARDARDWKAARALYVDESQKVVGEDGTVEYGGVDRMIKRSDALAAGQAGDEMDNVD
tara:strand:- start:4656 stop:5405 length:750 start_codon:yes stop_codon:yes gene_type:complete